MIRSLYPGTLHRDSNHTLNKPHERAPQKQQKQQIPIPGIPAIQGGLAKGFATGFSEPRTRSRLRSLCVCTAL